MTPSTLYIMAFAFALSLAVSGFMVYAGVGDVPDKRSNHAKIIPTCGGLGIIAALGGFFLLVPQFFMPGWLSPNWTYILTALWAVGLLGLCDDILTLPPGLKFTLLICLSAVAVWAVGPVTILPYAAEGIDIPYVAGFAGSVLWVFVVTNAVNFMDGSNGLMIGVMGIACFALAVIGTALGAAQFVFLPLALASGLLGLMPYNARRSAMIFSGDVGSLVTGFGFAVAVLFLCNEIPQKVPVFIGPVLILPFLIDVLLTMLRRAQKRENLMQPHKQHLYQKLIASGMSHLAVAGLYSFVGMCAALFAYAMTAHGFHSFSAFFIFPALIYGAIYYVMLGRLERKSA